MEGSWGVWSEVTATAGVSWDAGQDVDSLFHFPSAFVLPTVPCLYSLLLLLSALTYCIFPWLDMTLPYLICVFFFIMWTTDTPVTARVGHLLYCAVLRLPAVEAIRAPIPSYNALNSCNDWRRFTNTIDTDIIP